MVNFEKAVIAANFYELYKHDKKLVKSYLQQTLASVDAVLILRDIQQELNVMQDMQDIIAYEKALQQDDKAKPKKVEIIINKNAVKDAINMTHERIIKNTDLIKDILSTLSVTAYKYQLKYTYVILNEMIADAEVWDDVTYH